jgi:hypothetical protein
MMVVLSSAIACMANNDASIRQVILSMASPSGTSVSLYIDVRVLTCQAAAGIKKE